MKAIPEILNKIQLHKSSTPFTDMGFNPAPHKKPNGPH